MKIRAIIMAVSIASLVGCATTEEGSDGMGLGMALLAGAAMGLASAEAPGTGADVAILASAMQGSAETDRSSQQSAGNSRVAPRKSNCLNVERGDVFGSMTALSNSCAVELDVTWCFGTSDSGCHSNISSGTVPAFGRKTIHYKRGEYDRLAFISYACDASDSACFDTRNEYSRNLKAQSPRL